MIEPDRAGIVCGAVTLMLVVPTAKDLLILASFALFNPKICILFLDYEESFL